MKEMYTLLGFSFAFQVSCYSIVILNEFTKYLSLTSTKFDCSPMQVWAFEAIPFLGNLCARRAEGMRFPRCLNWKCRDIVTTLEKIMAASWDNRVRLLL